MPSPLSECAETLARLYSERAKGQIELNHLCNSQDLRQLTLTPADGWPGKNEAQRDAARDNALYADDMYRELGEQITAARDGLSELEATIDGVKETASALRWEIRERLASALERRRIEPAEDAAPSAPEFDSALQQETDELDF